MPLISFLPSISFVNIQELKFDNCSSPSGALVTLNALDTITISNFVLQNYTGIKTTASAIIQAYLVLKGSITLDNFKISNVDLGSQTCVHLYSAKSANVTVKNAEFHDIEMSAKVKVFLLGSLSGLTAQDISFTNVYPYQATETTNLLFIIESLDLNTTDDFLIEDMKVSDTSIRLFKLDNLQNSDQNGKSLIISGLEYRD